MSHERTPIQIKHAHTHTHARQGQKSLFLSLEGPNMTRLQAQQVWVVGKRGPGHRQVKGKAGEHLCGPGVCRPRTRRGRRAMGQRSWSGIASEFQ